VQDLADHDIGFAGFLRRVSAVELGGARGHALLLGRQTATERVAHFLHIMGQRLARHGAHIILPMGRADIADHLGLTVETVSRTLTRLRLDGVISVAPHVIGIRDAHALRALSGEPEAMMPVPTRAGGMRH
jgi:CRP-like cAMP-binding protein